MKKMILVVVMGLFVTILIMGDLPQKVVNYGVTPSYAMGPSNPLGYKPPTSHVPEPSTLSLMGVGIAGVGIYLFRKRNKKK